MKRNHVVAAGQAGISRLNFETFYEEISSAWETKAKALQARRWKMLKHAMKGEHHATR